MNVIIFGATGSSGRHLVTQALDKGYRVSAFSRSGNITDHSGVLRVIKGDVLNPDDVTSAVESHDIVFCTLGDGRAGGVRAEGTRNIINAMKRTGVRRLVCQTTLGCGESRNNLNFFWKHIMFGWLLKKAFLDHELQEGYIMESDLDWTIIRPGALTDGPLTRQFRHGFDSKANGLKLKISLADTAWFMLNQLESDQYIKKAAGLSY
jgi:putative NADH-flavin reductase